MPRAEKNVRRFNGKLYVRRETYHDKLIANQAKARYHGKGLLALVIESSKHKYTVWARIPKKTEK